MTLRVNHLHPRFFGEILGADLKAAPTEALRLFVERAMEAYAVCVVRQGPISDEEHLRFARMFGDLEMPPGYPNRRNSFMAPELFYAGNLDTDGAVKPITPASRSVAAATELFHSDSSFNTQPSKWSMLRGVECPPSQFGGDTLFVDMRAAYDDLDQALKDRVADLVGIHDFWEGRRRHGLEVNDALRATMPLPPVTHPIVRTLPYGRKTLFVGGHCVGVAGMPASESDRLLQTLYEHVSQEQYVYRHSWTVGDIVIWENRCALHAATPLTTEVHRRDMRRATVNETPAEQQKARAFAGVA